MIITSTGLPVVADRKESKLVLQFVTFVAERQLTVNRNRIVVGIGQGPFLTDAYVNELNLLIEAKGSINREPFRMAIGQLLDYRRFMFPRPQCAILLPARPNDDLLALAKTEGFYVIWKTASGFGSTATFW